MRTNFFPFICFLLLSSHIYAQSHKTQFSFEYSPGLLSNHYGVNPGDKWRPVHSAFAKADFYLNRRLDLTMGVGFFNTRTRRTSLISDYSNGTYIHHYSNFIGIPVGVRYTIQASFIHLELAGAYRFGNPVLYQTFHNGEISKSTRGEPESNRLRKFILPIFLSIGREIPLKKNSILIGLKGSMPLHNLSHQSYEYAHFYEAGLLIGLKFGMRKQ